MPRRIVWIPARRLIRRRLHNIRIESNLRHHETRPPLTPFLYPSATQWMPSTKKDSDDQGKQQQYKEKQNQDLQVK